MNETEIEDKVENNTANRPRATVAVGKFFWELIKVFLLAMVIIVPIRYFLVQPFFVRGASMEPTFHDGEYLVIDELSYYLRDAKRGEVVVFRFPYNKSQFFIKRIIGLPGETIKISDGKIVVENQDFSQGIVLDEAQYLTDSVRTGGQMTIKLGDEEYFVLGDNRAASSDSRSWGSLSRDAIVGRVWIRVLPFSRLGVIDFMRPGFISL